MPRVLAIVDDFMVRSRIEAAAGPETGLRFTSGPDDLLAALEPRPDLVLVGLAASRQDWEHQVRLIRAHPEAAAVPIVAFGPHRDLEARNRALAAGADRVLANSALMLALPALLRGEPADLEAAGYEGSE
jgi:CheY-like chemotaxis protein